MNLRDSDTIEDFIRRLGHQPRIFEYGRVSSAEQAEGYSLDEQRAGCTAESATLGGIVVGRSFEVGSGRNWELEGFVELEQRARRAEFDVAIVKDSSRLSRQRGKTAYLEHVFEQYGAYLHFYNEPFDGTPEGRLQRNILADFAEFELERTRARTMAGKRTKVANGRVVGNGFVPYGWRRVLDERGRTISYEHDPETAPVVRRIVRDSCHQTLHEVCGNLEADLIEPPQGAKRWWPSAIQGILNNPVTWGEYQYGRRRRAGRGGERRAANPPEEMHSIQLPPIVPRAEAQAAREAIAERRSVRRSGRRRGPDAFWLRGMLRCSYCQHVLAAKTIVNPAGRPFRYYVCIRSQPAEARRLSADQCHLPHVPADGIEAMAWGSIELTLLDEAKLREAVRRSREGDETAKRHAERLAFLRAEIARTTRALDKATREWAEADEGSAAEQSLGATRAALAGAIERLRLELADLEAYEPRAISADEEEELARFASGVREGLSFVTTEDKCHLCQLLRARGIVWEDPSGTKLGRHYFAWKLTGAIEFVHHDSQPISERRKVYSSCFARQRVTKAVGSGVTSAQARSTEKTSSSVP